VARIRADEISPDGRRLGLFENDGGPSEVFDLGAQRKLRGKK